MTLPTTQVNVNGFLVSDALLDSGSQLSLLDSRVYSVIAPNIELSPPARLVSASGHHLNAIGKCVLPVAISDDQTKDVEFTIVHNLSHDIVLGWDFMTASGVVLNCSPSETIRCKVRVKKPISVPARSAMCLSVKVDQHVCTSEEYLFVGQRSNEVEICDSLLKPFSETEMPLYVRNRSDRVITIHRRSVIGYVERVEPVLTETPEPGERAASERAAEVNAVSADDGRFVGKSTSGILSELVVGEPLSAPQRDRLAALLRSYPEVFSRGYADIGAYKGGAIDLELLPGIRPLLGHIRSRGPERNSCSLSWTICNLVVSLRRESRRTGIVPLFWFRKGKMGRRENSA